MGKGDRDFQWTADYLNDKEFSFAGLGTWRLTHKISEKTCQRCYPRPFESVTVFICEKISGQANVREKAIMKIRTEIPGTKFPHPDPTKRGHLSKAVNEVTLAEIERLEQLTKAGCTSTPRLLAYQRLTQNDKMWLPGGYLVCVLMQLVPGTSLEDFWDLPRVERDQARKAFRLALEEVWRLSRLDPGDTRPHNIIWDRQNQKCYIVDLEVCDDYSNDPDYTFSFSDDEYIIWCLAKHDMETDTLKL